ncbi:MAG: hypothetical protein ACR2RE_22780 [Geminicoccaceae bacterium]
MDQITAKESDPSINRNPARKATETIARLSGYCRHNLAITDTSNKEKKRQNTSQNGLLHA